MTRREQVQAALNHKNAGIVPLSYGSCNVDGFTKFSKDAYEKYLRYEVTPYEITSLPMGAVSTPQKILKLSQCDFRPVRIQGSRSDTRIKSEDGSYRDENGMLFVPVEYYYEFGSKPLAGDITVKDIENYPWMDPYSPGRADGLREKAKELYEKTDYAICADIQCVGPFELSLLMRGWEDFLPDFYENPALAEALMDKITEIGIGLWDVYLTEIGEYVDVVCMGDDLGMQDRPIISPELYHKYIKKYHKRMYDFVKTKTKAKIFLHSCGSVFDLIPGLIEAGIDILNPVQTSAKNMEPEKLKKEFGKDLVFWGGLDTQNLLPFGTPSEISDEVKRLMDTLGNGGGYVFAPSHNIQALVPPENIDSMITAAVKHSR